MSGFVRRLPLLVVVTMLSGVIRLDAGPWIETARLVHGGGASQDALGASVALDGDVAVVGQPAHGGAASDSGAAYVFVRSGGAWTEAATLLPFASAADDEFGYSVAISGDTIVVGSPGASSGGVSGEGLAFVFVRPAEGWTGTLTPTTVLYLLTVDGQTPDHLGASVAISADTVACGAPTDLENDGAGAVLVFVPPPGGWQAGTSLIPAEVLAASDGASGDALGYSVAISGDAVLGGAPFASNGDSGAGKAYTWVKPSFGWFGGFTLVESAKLLPSTPAAEANFGTAVAIDGTTAVVTSPFTQYTNSEGGATRVSYVFEPPSTGWAGTLNETARLTPNPEKINSFPEPRFGNSASISGDTVVIGTPGLLLFAYVGENDGGAFIFRKPVTGWTGEVANQAKIYRVDPSALHSRFGWSVAISGTRILVGAPDEFVDGNTQQGAAHVFEPGLNPVVTASFSPGSVLTHEPSTLSLAVANPNTVGFILDLGIGTPPFPANLFVAGTPNASSTCTGFFAPGSTPGDVQLLFEDEDPLPAAGNCTISTDVSSLVPGVYTTSALPVSCDQGCDGVGSAPATLLVRLRNTQTRFLVQGPIRVAPGVPVEFRFQVDSRPETALPISGEVVVSDGAGHACRSDVSAAGEGSCTLTFGSPGTFPVRASYLGDLSFGGSTSPPANVFVR